MKYLIGLLAVLSLLWAGLGAGSSALAAVDDPPPGSTVVDVSGDKANGFTIEHYDGTVDYPPTDSEARAECNEYSTRLERVRCRTEVRTWYHDLGVLKFALDYAHTHQ
ncbi:MAG: hypothetical protein JWO76_842 [Nocardioides sp.]|nr:hypothetical protein [Nocardioides sp.]